MFSQLCAKNTLAKCMNPWIGESGTNYLNDTIDTILNYDGMMFGSVITAYMLNDPKMKNFPARDIDILFRNARDMESFYKGYMDKLKQKYGAEVNFNTNEVDNQITYNFTNLLSDQTATATITLTPPEGRTHYMKFHCVCLKDNTLNGVDNNPEAYIEYLFKNFFIMDFTKAVHYDKKIFSKLKDIRNIDIRVNDMDNKAIQSMIRRYSIRGIKFNIVETVEEVNVNPDALKQAKDRYRSLGLVVIPLSTRDTDRAGKCPAVSGWNDKGPDYDFDTANCENIGLVCGKKSGIVCIDVDQKDKGMFYFDKMMKHYGMPKCPTQSTPNGGRHYIFKYDPIRMQHMKAKIKAASIGEMRIGIDLWISRCQFVAEPSVNHAINRPYTWIVPLLSRDEIPELPEWIYDLYESGELNEDGTIVSCPKSPPSSAGTASLSSGCSEAGDIDEVSTINVNMATKMLMFFLLLFVFVLCSSAMMMIMILLIIFSFVSQEVKKMIMKKVSKIVQGVVKNIIESILNSLDG